MDVYIAKLRKYLKLDEDVEILNIHGEGFRLVVKNKVAHNRYKPQEIEGGNFFLETRKVFYSQFNCKQETGLIFLCNAKNRFSLEILS
jgi:hypothetical protein